MKLETDKVLFAIGGLIFAFGLLDILGNIGNKIAYAVAPTERQKIDTFGGPGCPPGTVLNGNRCFCPKGQHFQDGKCVGAPTNTPTQQQPRQRQNNKPSNNQKSSGEMKMKMVIGVVTILVLTIGSPLGVWASFRPGPAVSEDGKPCAYGPNHDTCLSGYLESIPGTRNAIDHAAGFKV